jgi:hypothetical protein
MGFIVSLHFIFYNIWIPISAPLGCFGLRTTLLYYTLSALAHIPEAASADEDSSALALSSLPPSAAWVKVESSLADPTSKNQHHSKPKLRNGLQLKGRCFKLVRRIVLFQGASFEILIPSRAESLPAAVFGRAGRRRSQFSVGTGQPAQAVSSVTTTLTSAVQNTFKDVNKNIFDGKKSNFSTLICSPKSAKNWRKVSSAKNPGKICQS